MSSHEVVSHYSHEDPVDRILEQLSTAGLDLEALGPDDLSGVDEFHLGGRAATIELLKSVDVTAASRVLDVGSGIGGVARTIAVETGCTVDGIDLTPPFVATATRLSELVGLGDRTRFDVATALDLPFDDDTFDAVTIVHVGMNIGDKHALFSEAARVLAGGGTLHVYDIMRVADGELTWPLPWSRDQTHSYVAPPEEYLRALRAAGLQTRAPVDHTALVRAANQSTQSAPPAVTLAHLMGPEWPTMFANLGSALTGGLVAPVEIVASKN